MSRFLLLAALLLFSLGAPLAPALAADEFDPAVLDKMAEEAHQVPLTEDTIDRFVASYPEMRAIGAKFPATQVPTSQAASPARTEIWARCRLRNVRR